MIELKEASIGYEEPIVEASAKFEGKYFLLGPNGSGKTTLFRGIARIARLFSGEIVVEGDFPKLSTNLPEVIFCLPSKVRELIDLRADLMETEYDRIVELLELLDVKILDKRSYKLSSGEAKALALSISLGSNASNILLDEPLEALDPYRKSLVIEKINEYENIVLATHETFVLEKLRDRSVYLMFSGRLYGPFKVSEILESGIVHGAAEEAIVVIDTPRGKVSLVRGSGRPLTSIYSMDMLYSIRFLSTETFNTHDEASEEVFKSRYVAAGEPLPGNFLRHFSGVPSGI